MKAWLKFLFKIYVGLLVVMLALAVIVAATGNEQAGADLARNGAYYAVVIPVALIVGGIAWLLGLAHDSGVISGPQLLPILVSIAILVAFYHVMVKPFVKGGKVPGGGGGGGSKAHH